MVPFSGVNAQYSLTVESTSAAHVPGATIYRFYVNANDATDKMSAVFGNDEAHLVIDAPAGIFNSTFNALSASGINPAFLGFFPDMAEDSYATIGLEGPAAGAAADSLVEDPDLSPTISTFFTSPALPTSLDVNTLTGGSWSF